MQQSVLDFFDLNKDCPNTIKNCVDLRKRYMDEILTLGSGSGCSKCAVNRIKSKYIDIIVNSSQPSSI